MDRLIAVSGAIVAKLGAEGRTGGSVELVYNGVDLDRYEYTEACCTLPEEYGFPEGSPLVGVVARLEPEKGHATLLEAWPAVLERVPEARLMIIGEGSQRPILEARAEQLGLMGERCGHDRRVGTRRARPGAKVLFTGLRDDVPASPRRSTSPCCRHTARRRAWPCSRRWRSGDPSSRPPWVACPR